MQERGIGKLIILTGLFVGAILCANTLASKLFTIGGLTMTAGIVAFPITFLITDIINEVWGKKRAQAVVITGFLANLMMVALYQLGMILPPAVFWPHQEAFHTILGAVPRIVGASMIAYLISQNWDVWVFAKIKEKLRFGLWLRNNLSTITAQIIDSVIFLGLAFGGVMPVGSLVTMFFTYVLVKAGIALLDTPLVYLGVAWAKGKEGQARG